MNALTPITEFLPPALFEQDLAAADTFIAASKSAATVRAYRCDWAVFTRYCDARGVSALPASAEVIAAFLAHEARSGVRASSLGRRLAAIRFATRAAGFAEPATNSETVKATMAGIRRVMGVAKTQKAPATASLVRTMSDGCDGSMKGLRDRALLALTFAAALRRSEVVALTVADLVEVPDGYRIKIRRSKGDQEGLGQEVAVPRGSKLRPVEAVQAWLQASGITEGPVFRQVNRGGRVGTEALTAKVVALTLKAHVERAGLDPSIYSGHSLRSGFLTSAAEANANLFKMLAVSRHKSVETLKGYIRSADAFKDHAGASFL